MILISEILKNIANTIQYEIISEEPIDTLGLVSYFADQKSQCTFLDDIKYLEYIKENTKMVITTKDIAMHIKDKGLCITQYPRVLFFMIHNYLKDNEQYVRKINKSIIGNACEISKLASISQNNVIIGNNVIIEEFVSIKENTIIGDNVTIRAGAIIGSEGFEFKKAGDEFLAVNHLGGVKIGRNVEIQSNSCIDKAVYPWDDTVIGDNTKIDKLVYIAHGAKIGNSVLIVGQSGVLGRTIIEDNVKIGLGAGLKNAIHIGSNSDISIGAVVTKNVNKGEKVSGNFAVEHNKFINFIKSIR